MDSGRLSNDINHSLSLSPSVKLANQYSNFNITVLFSMRENLLYAKEYSVYPGEYIPLPEVEALEEELKIHGKDSAAKPLINMDEFKDCFKIEVVVPGVRREDIFIHVHDNVLSIVVLHKDCEELKKKLQRHEFESDFLLRNILLPDNADAEFISAGYRQGILSLHIPKTHKPSKNNTNQIVVY